MTRRARLDADRTARPLTELRGVVVQSSSGEGTCWVSPGVAWVEIETGRVVWLVEVRKR